MRPARCTPPSPSEKEVAAVDKASQARQKRYEDCLDEYRRYIAKENTLLARNQAHCQKRDQWFREEVEQAWRNAISNRPLVLRSVARTNVLKKDISEWLSRLDEHSLHGDSWQQEESAQDHSQLLDKYNDILAEYGHRV